MCDKRRSRDPRDRDATLDSGWHGTRLGLIPQSLGMVFQFRYDHEHGTFYINCTIKHECVHGRLKTRDTLHEKHIQCEHPTHTTSRLTASYVVYILALDGHPVRKRSQSMKRTWWGDN